MTGENEKKDEAKIVSRMKNLFSPGCGCGSGDGCCGTRIVPKAKKEEPEPNEE